MLFKLPELEQLPRFHSEVQRLALSVARAKPERRKGPSYGKIGPFDPGIPHGNCVSSFESDLMRGFRSVQATSYASVANTRYVRLM